MCWGMGELSQASPGSREDLRQLHAAEQARVDARAGALLLLVYLIDAALFAGFSSLGLARWWVPAFFVITGITVAGGFALAVAREGRVKLTESNAVLVQTVIALALTLGVAWTNSGVALPMLLTVIVILPTGALRLSPARLMVLSVFAALGCATVVSRHRGLLVLPVASLGQLLLTGVFFLWTLIKGASVNVAGMAMRLALDQSRAQLAEALARVEGLAESDELTGLANRRRILEVLGRTREKQIQGGQSYGIAMLDVDHFKRINDSFGHPVGDEVLRTIARLMRKVMREGDAIGRVGGEEFLLVLPGTSTVLDLDFIAERLRSAVEGHDWSALQPRLEVTASIGVAIGVVGEPVERVLQRADQGLYAAKRAGRNCVGHALPAGLPS